MTEAPSSSQPHEELLDRLVADMAASWRAQQPHQAEHYFEAYPELLQQTEFAVRLIYEEICLRQEHGQLVNLEELTERFPSLSAELHVVLECHRLMETSGREPQFPEVGEHLGDFRLVAELGQGSEGRVFLATQAALADRPVVLKVTPRRAREHLTLARLQHTHIIPLHALYDFPERNLRALCLPYLGGVTLAALLARMVHLPLEERLGRSLIEALDQAAPGSAKGTAAPSAFRSRFAGATYTEAICLLGVCLAEALQHAHERGLLHLDIKPSNVLLTAEAQPLLLDFHLARPPAQAGQRAVESLGGTPRHMAPEQERGLAAARLGRPLPDTIDARADIYSLGHLLYLALGGPLDAAGRATEPLHRLGVGVSVGLSDILHRCLQERASDRYPNAAMLAEDLHRHLADLPLRGVRNRSWGERWHKWRRRRPTLAIRIALVLAVLGVSAVLTGQSLENLRETRLAIAVGEELLRSGHAEAAMRTFSRAQERLGQAPWAKGLRAELNQHLHAASRVQEIQLLHRVAEMLHVLPSSESVTLAEIQALEVHCRSLWENRDAFFKGNHEESEECRHALIDLVLLWAEVQRRLAPGAAPTAKGPDMPSILRQAEVLLGPSPALVRERTRQMGLTPPRDADHPSVWERRTLGEWLLRAGELEQADVQLRAVLEDRPQDFWAHFALGVCSHQRGRFAEAVHAFDVALALAPRNTVCYHNRAVAHTALGNPTAALRDYDRALTHTPGFLASLRNRGILHYESGRLDAAREDLEACVATRGGADAHYHLAMVLRDQNQRGEALNHVNKALVLVPDHGPAAELRRRLLSEGEGKSP